MGQCLEHLCITNEAYLPPISVAIDEKPDSPVEQITPGWFGRWFIRSFIEPSPVTKRASAPAKIRPTAHFGTSVLERFLAGNQSCRELIVRARAKNVNRIRFSNPFIPGIRFTVGTGFQIIVGHERFVAMPSFSNRLGKIPSPVKFHERRVNLNNGWDSASPHKKKVPT